MNHRLTAFLVFLMLTSASCNKCQEEEITPKIIGISFSTESNVSNVMIPFQDIQFRVHVQDSIIQIRTVQKSSEKNITQYATVGPFGCEQDVAWTIFINDLDSMVVTSNKVYNHMVGNDITNILVISGTNRAISEHPEGFKKGFHQELYKLNAPPSKLDTFQFILQAKDSKGQIFKDTIPNLIISPM